MFACFIKGELVVDLVDYLLVELFVTFGPFVDGSVNVFQESVLVNGVEKIMLAVVRCVEFLRPVPHVNTWSITEVE